MPRKLCLHCQKRGPNRPRGLCWICHADKAICAKYPPLVRYADRPEETMADVEALIAEQMQNLPAWWNESRPHRSVQGPKPVETPFVIPMLRRHGVRR